MRGRREVNRMCQRSYQINNIILMIGQCRVEPYRNIIGLNSNIDASGVSIALVAAEHINCKSFIFDLIHWTQIYPITINCCGTAFVVTKINIKLGIAPNVMCVCVYIRPFSSQLHVRWQFHMCYTWQAKKTWTGNIHDSQLGYHISRHFAFGGNGFARRVQTFIMYFMSSYTHISSDIHAYFWAVFGETSINL